MGLRPQPILDVLNPSTERFVARALWASDEQHIERGKVAVDVRQLPPRLEVAQVQPMAPPPPALQQPMAPTRVMPAPPPPGTPSKLPPPLRMSPRARWSLASTRCRHRATPDESQRAHPHLHVRSSWLPVLPGGACWPRAPSC